MAKSNDSTTAASSKKLSFLTTAVAVVAIVFTGFMPTYLIPVISSTQSIPALLHLHAALFFGWVLIFLVQSILVFQGRLAVHRCIGKIAAVWTMGTITTGFYLAFITISRDLGLIDGSFGAVQTVIPFSQICMFTCLIIVALANTKRPDLHKRVMVLAALVATTPALARIGLVVVGEPSPMAVGLIFLASNGLIIVVGSYDAICTGRIHPVFLYGGLAILLVRIARVPFAMTSLWRDTAESISKFMY